MKRVIWIIDSGCSRHMTGDKALLSQFEEMAGPLVTFGDNIKGFTMGYGNLVSGNISIEDVVLVAGLEHIRMEYAASTPSHLLSKAPRHIAIAQYKYGVDIDVFPIATHEIRLEMFDPTSSSTASIVSCLNRRCDFKSPVIPEKICPYQEKQCKYTLEYGDGSTTSGYYVEDVIHIDRVVGSSVISNITLQLIAFGSGTGDGKTKRLGSLPTYGFIFKCNEIAEKRREYSSRLEKKIQAKELEENFLQARTKGETENKSHNTSDICRHVIPTGAKMQSETIDPKPKNLSSFDIEYIPKHGE
ncbi:hypothetical protein AgCh_005361 [Apium graveolens]